MTLAADNTLRVEPAGNIESLRHQHQHIGETVLPANEEVVLDSIQGSAMELMLEIEPGDAPMVEVNVLRSPNREELTRIAFFKNRGFRYRERVPNHTALNANSDVLKSLAIRDESLITIDTSYSSVLPDALSRAPETAPVYLEPNEPLRLRIFIDRSVVEVFVNGKQCVAVRVYPGRKDSLGVSLRAQGQSARLMRLDAWQMQSIWQGQMI